MVDGSRALAFFRQLSLAHRVGLSMIAAGVLIQVFSLILGELIFLMLSELVELLAFLNSEISCTAANPRLDRISSPY